MRLGGILFVLVLAGAGFGCASARMSDHETDSLFRQGHYDQAAERMRKAYEEGGPDAKDSLLYLLDLGLSLHSAGKYEESNKAFLAADKVAEIKDYTSLATESATLLTSDNIKSYKGEDFENVLISTYLAMNYSLMGDTENALVEARRVNTKLYRMVSEGARKYKQNAFARYLSAILYESEGDWNDAYIDYKNTFQLDPSFPGLGRDLWRMAWRLRMPDEMERWDQQFALTDTDHAEARKPASKSSGGAKTKGKQGEIIVLYENGISPIKKPHPNFHSAPKFYPRFNPVSQASVAIRAPASSPEFQDVGSTAMLENIEQTAIENLDEKYGGIIAKKVAGVVAKEVVGYEVGKATNSPLLGALTKIALYASDQADVRSWNLLPRDLQILRIPVDPGTYEVRVSPQGGPVLTTKTVQVGDGQKVFTDFRYMP